MKRRLTPVVMVAAATLTTATPIPAQPHIDPAHNARLDSLRQPYLETHATVRNFAASRVRPAAAHTTVMTLREGQYIAFGA